MTEFYAIVSGMGFTWTTWTAWHLRRRPLKDWDNITAATTGPMTITEFLAAKEKLEDEYLKPCQRCHGNGIDPIKGASADITYRQLIEEKLEDEYLKPCERCHGNGIDPIKGSIKADKERGPA
jgi:DnaJ-class molecular chaperone